MRLYGASCGGARGTARRDSRRLARAGGAARLGCCRLQHLSSIGRCGGRRIPSSCPTPDWTARRRTSRPIDPYGLPGELTPIIQRYEQAARAAQGSPRRGAFIRCQQRARAAHADSRCSRTSRDHRRELANAPITAALVQLIETLGQLGKAHREDTPACPRRGGPWARAHRDRSRRRDTHRRRRLFAEVAFGDAFRLGSTQGANSWGHRSRCSRNCSTEPHRQWAPRRCPRREDRNLDRFRPQCSRRQFRSCYRPRGPGKAEGPLRACRP